jgi:GT2 family glycosyltransferase
MTREFTAGPILPDSLSPLMDTLAPPVVAVVVAHDPGPWFEETLASLASQDYAELSVLILDAGGREDLAARVAAVLPTAFVRRFDENRGFGATVNEVLTMVDGADYFLVCHDDVALLPDTVHLMVEEAFRSNAGIVTPKVVSWDDPDRLVHVGMTADKGGSVVDRVQPHEIDHGQHDAVRDVFVAPGGATLIRADLFGELGGFDPDIVAMGEDLDLSWRAQVVGARIIVAPDARVRHREELAGGSRSIEPALVGGTEAPGSVAPVTLQELQRRHELLAVFKCYGRFHLFRVVPQVLALAIAEVVVAALAGNRARVRAVVRAWRWNLGRLSTTRLRRKELRGHRRLSDKEVRLLQVGGSARLSSYFRRVFQHGFHGAHADELAAAEAAGVVWEGDRPVATTSAQSPEAGPDTDHHRGRLSGRVRLTVWLIAAVAVLIGTRGVLTGRLPAVGQFVPFPSWGATLAQFATGWHPSGVGTTAPASPGLLLTGLVGTVLLGAMGLAQKVLIFGCIPLGAWGTVRLLRPFGSQRAALVAGLAYLAAAVPYNALALGRWGALVVYAGSPWALARLFRATGTAPYPGRTADPDRPAIETGAETGAGAQTDADAAARTEGELDPDPDPRPDGDPAPDPEPRGRTVVLRRRVTAWVVAHPRSRSALALGLLEAVMISFVPAAAVVVVLAALALVVSSALFRDLASTRQSLWLALASTGVAAAICLPWVIGVLWAGRGAVAVFGVPIPASSAASWSSLLRFAAGPIGGSPLAYGFAVAAAAPLVLARGSRFRWAGRFWVIALVFWLAAWVIGRGWTGSLAIDPLILLAPASVAVAAAIGLGVAAFEEDLRAAEFGWRQLVTVVASVALVLGALPTAVSALPGRWELPVNDFSQSVAWMHAKSATGAFRVLWLGQTNALTQGSWAATDDLAYATSEDGGPDARWLWSSAGPGPASELASAVDLARQGGTDQLGRLLAPAGVRYVALLTSLAPEISGEQSPTEYPVPADVAPALDRQLDLSPVLSGTGITVYQNSAWLPQRAEVPAGTPVANSVPPDPRAGAPGSGIATGAVAVLPGAVASRTFTGPLTEGTVLASVAPAGKWSLAGPGGAQAPRTSSFGWAARYRVATSGTGTLQFDGGLLAPLSFVLSLVTWLVAIALLLGDGAVRPWRRIRFPRPRPRPQPRANSAAAGGDSGDGGDTDDLLTPDTGTATGVGSGATVRGTVHR